MKKFLIFLVIMSSFLIGCNKNNDDLYASKIEASNVVCDSCAKKEKVAASAYGIYGEVAWPVSGTKYNAVECPTVSIFKKINGSWVSVGATTASICCYYTYEVSGIGTYRATINGYYYLRSYPNCATRVDYSWYAGSGDCTVTIGNPWTIVDVRCA